VLKKSEITTNRKQIMPIGKQRRTKSGGGSFKKKMAGRPMPVTYTGCKGDEEKKHSFQIYGKPLECCVHCGKEHRDITRWRSLIVEGDGGYYRHPYVEAGILSGREYAEMMKKGGGFLR
jgi:hypothetical protein